MDNQIKNRFLSLKLTGQRSALSSTEKKEQDLQTIQYLQSVLDKREVTSFEEYAFYKIAYLSLLSRVAPFDKVELKKMCEKKRNQLSHQCLYL